jgi:hypothetical protein
MDCKKRSTIFIRYKTDENMITCEHCGNHQIQRIMSGFSSILSEDDRLERMADPSSWRGLDESDPKSVAKFVKKMGRELGDEATQEEVDQMADEAARDAESDGTSTNNDTE